MFICYLKQINIENWYFKVKTKYLYFMLALKTVSFSTRYNIMFNLIFLLIRYVVLPLYFMWFVIKMTYRRNNSKIYMKGKTAIVTGGCKGIGFQTVLGLVERNCNVIIACRNNGETIRQRVIQATHNQNIMVRHLDLSSLSSVRKFAQEIKETETKVDILIHNAGVASNKTKYTQDGLHPIMQVNFFGAFLLTHLLIDVLKKSEDGARIIFVSSVFAYLNNLSSATLNYPQEKSFGMKDYFLCLGNSKLCEIIASNVFADKLKTFGITSNVVYPGLTKTDMCDHIADIMPNVMFKVIWQLSTIFFKTAEEASQVPLRAAMSDEYQNVTGTFSWDFKYLPSPRCIKDKNFCRQIWQASEHHVKLQNNEKI